MAPKSATEKQHNKVVTASSENQEPPQPREMPQQTSQVTRQQQQEREREQQEQQQPLKRLALIRRQLFCGFMSPSLSIEKQNSDRGRANISDRDDEDKNDDEEDSSSLVKLQISSATTQKDKGRDKSGEKKFEEKEEQQQQHHSRKTKNKISNKINELSKCSQTFVKPTTSSSNHNNSECSSDKQPARHQLGQQLSDDRPTLECCISLSGFQLRNASSSSSTSNTPSRNLKNNRKQQSPSNLATNSSEQVLASESGVQIDHQLVETMIETYTSASNTTKQQQQRQLQNKSPESGSSRSLKLTNQREVLELIGGSSKGDSNSCLSKIFLDQPITTNTSERLFLLSHNSNNNNNSKQHSSEINGTTTTTTCSNQQQKTIISQSIPGKSSSSSSTKSTNAKLASSSQQATQSTRQLQSDMKAQEHDRMNQLISLLNQFAKQQEQQEQQPLQHQDEESRIKRSSDVEQGAQVDSYYLEENWTSFVHLRSTSSAFSCYPPQPPSTPIVERQNSDLTNSSTTSDRKNNQLSNLKIQQDAIWELLTTEVFYIKRLKVIIDLFLNTLLGLQRASLLLDVS